MYHSNNGNTQRILYDRPMGLCEVGCSGSGDKSFLCGDKTMIVCHRILFIISCIIAFFAGAINAGAQEIASQRAIVSMLISQPISTLTRIEVGKIEL